MLRETPLQNATWPTLFRILVSASRKTIIGRGRSPSQDVGEAHHRTQEKPITGRGRSPSQDVGEAHHRTQEKPITGRGRSPSQDVGEAPYST